MKINEAEQLLGITKANIRFYEKEGLLTPSRTEHGYREYTPEDILRLKQIIILRKLGISVQQIAEILDGTVSLKEAVDDSIQALNMEIEKLNGSLSLCYQIKSEGGTVLDTERYWNLIQSKEHQGMRFHTLAQDYLNYVDQHFRNTYPAEGSHYTTKKAIARLLLICIVLSVFGAFAMTLASGKAGGFMRTFADRFLFWSRLKLGLPLLLGLFLIPAFWISRKNKKYGKAAEYIIKIILAILIFWIGLTNLFAK